MRGSDLGGCQSSARVCETHAPPSVAARPHANNSTDNRDTCDAHKLSRAPGRFTRKTRGNEQKVARLGLTHNEKSQTRPGCPALRCNGVNGEPYIQALGSRLSAAIV